MISYAWRGKLSRVELADIDDLLAQAAAYDEEAGFSTADPRAAPAGPGPTRHLLVRSAPAGRHRGGGASGDPAVAPLTAYLRVDVSDGTGDVSLVVRPECRSHGIATLLLECLAEPGGWAAVPGLRGLRAWAHGRHPAADRARSRLGAATSGVVFKTRRPASIRLPLAPPAARLARRSAALPPPEVMPGHQRAMASADRAVLARASLLLRSETPGRSVLAGADQRDPAAFPACLAVAGGPGLPAAELTALLAQGLLEVQSAGARTAQMYIDARDSAVVLAARELGFEHDQSDCCYVLGLG